MNRIIYILSFLFCFSVFAQESNAKNVSVAYQSIKKVGEEIVVSMEVEVTRWDPKYRLIITPVIYNESNQQALEPLKIVGRFKHIAELREGIADVNDYILKNKTSLHIPYEIKVPYEEWMQEVSLSIEQMIEGCCSVEEKQFLLAEDKLLYHKILPEFSEEIYEYEFTELEQFTLDNPFLHPSENYNKRFELFANDKEKKSVQVYFKQGISRIDINYGNNQEVLDKIEKAFKLIDDTPEAELSKVVIAGFASPEGSEAINNRLAERRALSVKEFIKTIMTNRYDEEIFEFFNGGKDWDGLLKLLAVETDLAGKEEAIEIIKNYRHLPDCNDRLKKINKGNTYAYLLKELYPQLRNAGFVQVYYNIVRTADIATEVTDEEGRSVWIDTESSTNIIITRLNEATLLMLTGKYEQALEILEEVKEDKRAFNHIGVCYMMQKNYDKAEYWLNKAISNDDPYATNNLNQIKLAKRVEM